jgi:tRNA(fMet)-specific endonuclease VapC
MPVQYLLDTNIASYIIKGNVPAVRRKLLRIPMAQIFISSITEAELRYGVALRPGAVTLERIVEEFLLHVTTMPWDSQAAREYANLRAEIERIGQPMGNLDLLIAAHALSLGAVLVTSDRAFSRIKKLKIENWTV